MEIGSRLSELRKKYGYTQKQLAEALNLSQQRVSNIERNTTAPDVEFLHGAADLYKISLDELIEFDIDLQEIEEMIDKSDEKLNEKVNWTNAWGKKYPILLKYQTEVNTSNYAFRITKMFDEIKNGYGYSKQDAMLVLKDILYQSYKIWNK